MPRQAYRTYRNRSDLEQKRRPPSGTMCPHPLSLPQSHLLIGRWTGCHTCLNLSPEISCSGSRVFACIPFNASRALTQAVSHAISIRFSFHTECQITRHLEKQHHRRPAGSGSCALFRLPAFLIRFHVVFFYTHTHTSFANVPTRSLCSSLPRVDPLFPPNPNQRNPLDRHRGATSSCRQSAGMRRAVESELGEHVAQVGEGAVDVGGAMKGQRQQRGCKGPGSCEGD